jgi:myo-inositol 2-dehydrogenase/D-chiro-inositol 1-dehydrogenase/scyllo-inositol 2-dehydrogenase (NAD+)
MPLTNVCLIGAGRAGALHATNVHRYVPDARMTAIVDDDPARAADVAAGLDAKPFATLAAAIAGADIDAVVIATPTFTHRDLAVEALEAGLHVFCEKPMALSAAECDDMNQAAAAAGRVLQIGYVRRYQPEFVEAFARIANGDIGDVTMVKSLTRGPGLPPAWAHDIALSNGMLAEVNSHCFDTVRWMTGSEVTRVYAEVANHKGERNGVTVEGFYDTAVVTLRFASDAVGVVDGVCPAQYGYDARVEVIGTEGLITIGDTLGMPVLTCVDRSVGGTRPVHKTWPERFSWGYVHEITGFVDAVRGGEMNGPDGVDGKRAVEIVVAANRSWQETRPVELVAAAA